MKLIICCYNKSDFNIVDLYFKNKKYIIEIEVVRNDIIGCFADVIASAGNSFGMMDGGIDRTINYNLNYICNDVQEIIKNEYYGECPVGSSFLVKTQNSKFKYLCYAPTMRIPEPVNNTINAYLALRSVLITCFKNKINSVVIPLFCGGAGEMPIDKICHQYNMAIESLNYNFCDWKSINIFHKNLIL
jgi:O-acetyl-ADP-ribose deacetylase (regulator of RNase III)